MRIRDEFDLCVWKATAITGVGAPGIRLAAVGS